MIRDFNCLKQVLLIFFSRAEAADLVNPIPKSVYQQRYNDKLESIYESKRRKPLGQCPDPTQHFPEGYKWKEASFGIKNKFCNKLHKYYYYIIFPFHVVSWECQRTYKS